MDLRSPAAQEPQDSADVRGRIERAGFESLKVAVAGGIMMYELSEKPEIGGRQ